MKQRNDGGLGELDAIQNDMWRETMTWTLRARMVMACCQLHVLRGELVRSESWHVSHTCVCIFFLRGDWQAIQLEVDRFWRTIMFLRDYQLMSEGNALDAQVPRAPMPMIRPHCVLPWTREIAPNPFRMFFCQQLSG